MQTHNAIYQCGAVESRPRSHTSRAADSGEKKMQSTLFLDAVAIVQIPALKKQFHALPRDHLLAMLRHPNLKTDSEDTVLALLHSWVLENNPDKWTRRELLECICMQVLSDDFFQYVIPGVPWICEAMAVEEYLILAKFRSMRANVFKRDGMYTGHDSIAHKPA